MNNEYEKIDENIPVYTTAVCSLDDKILYILSEKIKNVIFDKTMPVFSIINDFGCIYIAVAIFSMLTSKSKPIWIYIIMALIFGSILGEGIIKHIVKRSRPIYSNKHRFLIKIPSSYSFPSGHTTSSFAVLGVLWSLDSNYKYLVLILALLISFSRMYLHVHNPSDIIGGIILVLLCSKLTIITLNELYLRHYILYASFSTRIIRIRM